MYILGIHGGVTQLHHEPSATLIRDNKILFAAEEERFVRQKHGIGRIPIHSIGKALEYANIAMRDIDAVVHAGETNPDLAKRIELYLEHYFGFAPPIRLVNHQLAHLASAYYCSGFKEAICLSFDGMGDELSIALAIGRGNRLEVISSMGPEMSLGRFYSAITSFLGFEVGDSEYKVMGLAAYGKAGIDLSPVINFSQMPFCLDTSFFRGNDRIQSSQCTETLDPPIRSRYEPWYSPRLVNLLGPPRRRNEPVTQRHKDIALAAQNAFEQAAVNLVTSLYERFKIGRVAIAGGCALNCTANYKIRKLDFVTEIFVQPAASDRGISLGCALLEASRRFNDFEMRHVYLGPTYQEADILKALRLTRIANYKRLENHASAAAELLSQGNIIGWFSGRSEFGPRALGNRSILADPRDPLMKDKINERVKFREEFRPFAPAVLESDAYDIFHITAPTPFMTFAADVREGWKRRIPAVVHVDNTARVQTISQDQNPNFFHLLSEFKRLTNCPVLLNTSFNVMGEPIVETPLDAISTFHRSGLDYLFLENYMVYK